MKNYIANSGHGWDTSADYIRRQLGKCIELGRRGRRGHHGAQKESFIHLGAALHTLEDFAAHSNFVELCLHELGERDVFAYVGDRCRVRTPRSHFRRGRLVAPLVTGTFGMLDIFHSLLGEADDMAILQSRGTLGDLEEKLGYGSVAFDQLFQAIKSAIAAVQKFSSQNTALLEQLEVVDMILQQAKDDGGSPSTPEGDDAAAETGGVGGGGGKVVNASILWQAIEPVFYIHDRIKKWLTEDAETNDPSDPGNTSTQLGETTNQFVFQLVGYIIESSVKELRNALKAAKVRVDQEAAQSESAAVYEDGSKASDPSHSDLSKDHFSNVLNPPAGLVATVTTNWTTQQVVRCWDDESVSAHDTIERVLAILHHPAFPRPRSDIQKYMFGAVREWWGDLPDGDKDALRRKLARESVRERGHEDHGITVQDVRGKRKGPGEFPGSRMDVRPPRRKRTSLLKWAVGGAARDLAWVARPVVRCVAVPGGMLVDAVWRVGGVVLRTPGRVRRLAGRWWPFPKRN